MGTIFALYGPSASGKTEIQKQLVSSRCPRIVTATTRAPRENEVDGEHYVFLSRDEFRDRIKDDRFIEWTEYNGEFYGTLKSSADKVVAGDGSASVILDWAGVHALKRLYPNVFAIYVGANIESIERRLRLRTQSDEDLRARIERARKIELRPAYTEIADAIVWNNDGTDFADTLAQVREIVANADTDR